MDRRIIPARAGFTRRHLLGSEEVFGSSPLARGLHCGGDSDPPHGRIIPARAGFTAITGSLWTSLQDHPRSRGVYQYSRPAARAARGSSPLARGLLDTVGGQLGRHRIIPARAGFTECRGVHGPLQRDHPRSRGVYVITGPRVPVMKGSSPLARGLRRSSSPTSTSRRIIPARAGFTERAAAGGTENWDHPRSRGVYYFQPPPVGG